MPIRAESRNFKCMLRVENVTIKPLMVLLNNVLKVKRNLLCKDKETYYIGVEPLWPCIQIIESQHIKKANKNKKKRT